MNFIRLNGTTLHYRHRPFAGRPTFVFVNSLGTDMRIWNSVESLLADSFGLVFYDKRGHGLSELGDAPHTIETHAADLAALLDHLSIGNATICGLSIGGVIAQCLYRTRPLLIDRLILCDTAAKIGTDEMWNGRIRAALSDGISSFADSVLEKWFTPDFHARRPDELSGYRTMLVRQLPSGYAAACAAIRDADYRASAASIEVPTLCVVGEQDGSTPPDLVAELARSIPGARFEVIAGAGHIPCVEQPERLAELIRGFAESDMQRKLSAVDRYGQGMATRRKVLGDAHVDRAEAARTPFDAPFQQLITEAAWGHVWSRDTISARERSMMTIALLAALGHDEEVAMHVRASVNTGATRDDVREALLHVALYAGVPAANRAFRIAKRTFAEMETGARSE